MTSHGVAEKPILFSGPLIRAILAGTKTQTRRLLNPQPPSVEAVLKKSGSDFGIFTDHHARPDEFRISGPVWAVREAMGREPKWRSRYGAPGGRLWVRETWQAWHQISHERDEWEPCEGPPSKMIERYGPPTIEYAADERSQGPWTPSIHMPRWASRIALEVTSVRVEQLQDITADDVIAEGISPSEVPGIGSDHALVEAFHALWDGINGERASWASNPWVWVVEFRRLDVAERAA